MNLEIPYVKARWGTVFVYKRVSQWDDFTEEGSTLSKLRPEELKKTCDPAQFDFATTAEVQPLKAVIGQERARRAVSFGLDVKDQGYNIFLSGFFGTGRATLAWQLVEDKVQQEPVPGDWCYVFNFRDNNCPRAIKLPAGKGKRLVRDMDRLVDQLRKAIPRAYETQTFELQKNHILSSFYEDASEMYERLSKMAREQGFAISRTQEGISTIPLQDGEPMSQEEFAALDEDERQETVKKSKALQEKLNVILRVYRERERDIKAQVLALEQETARSTIVPYFNALYKAYRDQAEVVTYLEQVHQDILENLDLFGEQEETAQLPLAFFRRMDRRAAFKRYQVNLLADNSILEHAPVIYETNPTYTNLFGAIEYEGEFGVLSTDFTKVRAGAVHRANGGYLILNLLDLFKNPFTWDALKQVLKNQEVRIESVWKNYSTYSLETLEPEPIPVQIKVILIGEPHHYYLLHEWDEDFRKLFKLRADFDVEMARDQEHIEEYARFIKAVCEENGLRHFSREAAARVVDYGTRLSGHQDKLTTLFNRLSEIIHEADVWAAYDGAGVVEASHVLRAIEEKQYRAGMMEEKILALIEDGTLIIDVHGEKVGQINGLAVYVLGEQWFGKPCRITARTFMGEKGLVNIEREIHMSGNIHSKGVLTLTGYLGATYAQDKPLSLSASLTFEQNYQGIEGDSASSAELYAILSSLSGVPIRQGIAVTGSINQNGDIQPIGGVNQKIEGFFKVCRKKGLSGEQGVIIPRQNVVNLMLSHEVIEAVEKGEFHIWAIDHVDQGIEILTGKPAGKKGPNGEFTRNSIHYLVDQQLARWAEQQRNGNRRRYSMEPHLRGRRIRPGRR
ncbi:MAG: AAA family ATPase [Syntrophomonadaceae bacterium]|jgi:lon-related putative ATP-dependent protease|nr:AAA family ATPase [Syntrophomonadaceae bacterium]